MLTTADQDGTDTSVCSKEKKARPANVLVSSSRPGLTAGGRGTVILPWNFCSKAAWVVHFLCMISG